LSDVWQIIAIVWCTRTSYCCCTQQHVPNCICRY